MTSHRQTATEKIIQAHSVGLSPEQRVRAGDIVSVRPRHVMTHDNTGAVIPKFRAIGAKRIADPRQPVFTLDHNVQDTGVENQAKYDKIESFAREHEIAFHPAGAGIGHQIMIERGFVHPGALVVASDSHSNMYGALAALGTPVVRTDAAAIWATGTTWWQVPRSVRVVLEGKLRPGVRGKDVIITLCGLYSKEEVLNAAVEFSGDGVAGLSINERMTIANMSTEWGALVGWFPFDARTAEYLRGRARRLAELGSPGRLDEPMIAAWEKDPPGPDSDAIYTAEIHLDLGKVSPHVAGPDTVFSVAPAAELARQDVPINKAYLLSCVNARCDDLAEAAEVLRGKRVAPGVKLYLAAASAEVEEEARRAGVWSVLVEAGATVLPPGCGACIGLGEGTLEPGEVGISATNRNFKGRMGSRDAKAYLASPAVVAASAACGKIALPPGIAADESVPALQLRDLGGAPEPRAVAILPGFPASLDGRALLLPVDNLNTDGIYGKDVTYRDDLTPEQMAAAAMANYDPSFQALAQRGDIIVSGRNFGTGSSREQAATSLKHRGIQLVIAASFSQTYLRNAFNNAFICLESPALSEALRDTHASEAKSGQKTIISDALRVDFARSVVVWRGREYALSPMGPAAQELILAGGLEQLVANKL